MTLTYDKLKEHLAKTGRMKLLPKILRELKEKEAREAMRTARVETAKTHPELISGSRTIKDGTLTDTTGKRALLDIYQNITR